MLSTLVLFSLTASTLQATAEPLPFISDDFTRAQSEARARHVPVFVDVWAPW
jgi:hypothetical protein